MQELPAKKDISSSEQKRAQLILQLKKNSGSNQSIKRQSNVESAPLSSSQEPLWITSQLEPDSPIYNVSGAIRLQGVLNTEVLQQSLDEVIRRHEILRSRFEIENGHAVQKVTPTSKLILSKLDLTGLKNDAQLSIFHYCANNFTRSPFDLTCDSPIRIMLAVLGKQQHILLLALHHIVSDRWSVGIFMQEVAALYTAFSNGLPSTLPELNIQYGDFSTWQREHVETIEKHLGYWQRKLDNAPPLLELPTDHSRPSVQRFRGNQYSFELPQALSAAIKVLVKQQSATLFMVMAAALNALFYRYTGNQDIVIGYTSAGRNQAETENLIGFFVNTLVLRSQFQDDLPFSKLLKQLCEQSLEDLAYQDVSFGQLVEAVKPVRNNSHAPLFQVMLTVQNAPTTDFRLPELQVQPIDLENRISQFDLTYLIEEKDEKLHGIIEYSTDLFDVTTLERMSGHLETLLEGIVSNPNSPLNQLPLLTKNERRQLLIDWNPQNETQDSDCKPRQLIHQIFEAQAKTAPDKTALIFASEVISYRELDSRANQLAHYLQEQGITPESRVGVSAERSVELIVALLAVLKAGAAYVPLDPDYPEERLNYIIHDAGIELLMTQSALLDKFRFSGCYCICTDESYSHCSIESPTSAATLDNAAYLIYTSGSTGQPKGVLISHRNVLHSTLARTRYYHDPLDCFLLLSSFAFDSSVAGIFWTLSQGAKLCLPQSDDVTNPVVLAKLIHQHQVSHTLALPSYYKVIISDGNVPLLSSLKTVIVAGEACTVDITAEHHRKLPNVKFFNEYGPTEATVWSSVYESTYAEVDNAVPIGRTLENVQIYILDKQCQPVPIGVSGELYIGGSGLAQGYLNQAGLTAEKFIPNPFGISGQRLYKTGDLARYRMDGNIEFLGRIDHQVKIRGYRIELGEIEARLAAFHSVNEAVVTVREDQPGNKRLIAYLTVNDNKDVAVADLRSYLLMVLPEHMVPSAFVVLEDFPLTANGKLDRRSLPNPDMDAVVTQQYEAPEGAVEVMLAQIWQELLGIEQVGRYDNFFELGGHSLIVITLIELLQKQKLSVDVQLVFAAPVLAEMAEAISQSDATDFAVPANKIPSYCTAITPDMLTLVSLNQDEINNIVVNIAEGATNIQDIYPLAPLQQGILFHHLLEAESDAYLKRSILSFDSRSRLDNFLDALQQVINRHDILRSAVFWEGLLQPLQVVHRQALLPIKELTLLLDGDTLTQLLTQTELHKLRMNLHWAPLFAAYIVPDACSEKWLLALVNHHIIDDNYTLQLIIAEIQQILNGQADQLPIPLPYRNFIAQALAVSPAEHEAYFRTQLSDITEPTTPFGLLDIQGDGGQVTEANLPLTDNLARRIRSVARQQGVSAAVLFHVAWAQVLSQCTGRGDVVFGSVLLGRLQGSEGADRVLGMFINTLPVRISLKGLSVGEVVNASYRRLSGLLDHEQASLALAQRCSGVDASLPLFTTLFNYRHSDTIAAQDSTLSDIYSWEGMQVLRTEERTNYPITLSVDDTEQGFGITAQCVQGIDPECIAAYLNTAIEGLVDALAKNAQRLINTISVLPEPERHQLLVSFNGTAVDYPQDRLIHQLFEEQAAHTPAAAALTYGGQSLSYQALNTQANQLAHHLISLGVRPDDRVAICVERSLGMVIGLLGILKAGGAYVPLDPGYPKERLAYMLSDSAPVALLTQAALKGTLEGLSATVPVILLDAQGTSRAHSGTDTDASAGSAFSHCPGHNPDAQALGLQPRHLAYVIYTSGSTGQPKGVMVEHGNVARLFAATQEKFNFGVADVWTLFHSFAFDFSVWELWGALMYGGRLVIVSYETSRAPEAFYQLLCQQQVTVLNQTPSSFRQLISAQTNSTDRHALRCVVFGGEALDFHSLKPWIEHNSLEHTQLINMYGITEITVHATYKAISQADIDNQTGSVIGNPLADLRFYILDAHLQPVPLGVAGEIYIGGAGVARGYLNRPGLTAERFVANPFGQTEEGTQGGAHPHANNTGPSARLYKTGDLGRWLPDGTIEFLGRNDFQVKIRGFRIELGEVESQLSKCPGVREAVVIAREDSPGDKRLVAYLLARDNAELSAADLRSQLAAVLADHQLPGAYVTLESFPLTPNGKLDRKALPAPDGASVVSRGYEAPQGPIETAIARIWQELLQLDQVGRHDHFFELGGHSLLAVQLVSRLRQELDVEVPLRDLFAQATLAGFAQIVTTARQAALPPILSADRSQALPLSWAQQRLWFLDQLDPAASVAYHIPAGLRLHGTLDRTALQAALDQIIARHEGLRTTFVSVDGQPSQVIALASIGFTLLEHDLRGLAPPEQATTVSQFSADEASQPFDLATGPLIRGQLLQLAEDEHILLITQHHIVSDGWSMGILIREFSSLYAAFRLGQPDPLPTLGIQYADYAAWQRQWLQGDTLQAQIDFWQSHLTGAPGLLELPTDRPRPATQSYVGGSVEFTLSTELGAGLKQLAQRHGSTLFMVLLTGWSILMARLSGQGDIVIGTPVANRQRTEVEALIGFFVNTLALRVKMEGNPSVEQLLNQVKTTTLSAYAHQDIPFEQVVDIVKPERSLGQSPVFQVMVTMDNTPDTGELSLPGLTLSGLDVPHTTTQFDLSLSLSDTGGRVVGSLEYASELFDRATIERFVSHFQTLLAGIVADGQQRISQLPLLTQPERQRLLISFNGTAVDYPQDRLIHQLFEEQAAHTPAAAALTYGGQSLSYQALNTQANQLAHHLISLGVRPDDRVAICVERSLGMVIGLLGILKAGGAYVPLDPGYPKERLAYMLSDSAPVALLTQAALKGTLEGLSATVPVILLDAQGTSRAHSGTDTDASAGSAFSHCPGHNPDAQALGLQPRHLAYVIYTSGSTGQPKGVMVEHGNVANLIQTHISQCKLTPADRILQFASISFDNSVAEIFPTLSVGATLILRPIDLRIPDPQFITFLQSHQITFADLPTAFWHHWAQEIQLNQSQPVSTLRLVVVGGEKTELRHLASWMAQLNLFDGRLIHNYGPTEATVNATAIAFDSQSSLPINDIPIGRPIANTQIYILDAHLQPVPLGVAGEIYIGGAGVARGYLNRPGLTAERFVANPFGQTEEGTQGGAHPHANNTGPSARLYKTGDLGRWLPDGTIEFLGRNDFQVKIRGFRIELGEVESQLSKCPGVREAVVIAREDSPGDKRLVAYLLARDNAELSAADLRSQLAAVLADHQLPGAYVTLESFPLTPNGKLDRKALPAPDGASVVSRGYEAPQGPIETAIARIWQELLQLDQVGRHDHFFELGGHSLLIVTLIERLRQQGLSANVRTVFTAPVLAEMAAAIDGSDNGHSLAFVVPANLMAPGCTAITPDLLPLVSLTQDEIDCIVKNVPQGTTNIQDIYPLAPLQEGILFHHLLESQGDAYLLNSVISFDSRSRLDSFLNALQQVINRHDILRTAVCWEGLSQPVQVVYRQATLPLEELNLGAGEINQATDTLARKASQAVEGLAFESAIQDTALQQLIAHTDPRHLRLDLQHAPLFKAYITVDASVQEGAQGQWLLALLNHHMVCDHITLEFILAEIQQILNGQADQLPIPLPYRNFIAQALAVSPAEHEAYFRTQLSDITEPTTPFGLLDIQGDGGQVTEANLPLTDNLARRIRSVARQQGVSAAVLFHVAWAQVLSQCTGRGDVVFGSVLLGRLQGSEGADRVLGMFINTLPVRISLKGLSVGEVVNASYRRLSGLLDHEQASLALAQRCSGVDASLPLFTTLFNYRHSDTIAAQDSTLSDIYSWEGMQVLRTEERTNYPITLSVDDTEQGFGITAQCVQGIDPECIAAYLNTAIEGLVDALAKNAQRLINTISVLPEPERHQLLVSFNGTAVDYPQDRLIHQLFEEQAAHTPAAAALTYGGQSLSYQALNTQANQLAHHLISLGVRPDDRVAICVERSLGMVIGLLGILKAGGAYVPLDPGYPKERLAYMLSDSAPVALLTQAALKGTLEGLSATVPVILLDAQGTSRAHSGTDTDASAGSAFSHCPGHNPDAQALGLQPRHLAYVIYTSGSTGQPKGVMVEHGNVARLFAATQEKFNFGVADVWTLFHSFAFDFSVWELWGALMYGGRLVIVSYETSRAPEAFYQLLCQQQVTVLNQTPSSFRQLISAQTNSTDRHALRCVVFGGEALDFHSLKPWIEHNSLEHTQLINMYGITEITVHATYKAISQADIDNQTGSVIGNPLADLRFYILDAHLQPVPLGVAGEIYIGGAGVARGYLNRPGLTAERFVANPFGQTEEGTQGGAHPHANNTGPSARLYKTGDLGRWLPDGTIEFLGRNDFQVKIRGFRIELGEVESQLSKCPGVREAVVIAREDSPGDKRLVAYLLARDNAELSAADLRSQLAAVLADHQLPGAYVTLESFPLTPNGKLDRKALPAPDGASVVSRGYEAPQGPIETAIARIWQELLQLDQVGRHDHFFELGGHSLLAVQLVSRLRQELDVEVPLRDLFAQATLAGFAQIVTTARQAALPPILSADRSQALPLSWAQQRLWFLDQLDPAASVAYHIPAGLRLHGTLDRTALQAALDQIIARHEGLRTTFVSVDGQPSQVIALASIGFTLLEHDLRGLAPPEQATTVSQFSADEASQPFDLATGPLIRGQLLQLAEDEHILLITQHHIVSDGWSMGILIREFSSLYAAFRLGQPDPLPTLGIQYADYAAWQRQWLQGDTLQAQIDFWQSHLTGAPGLLELPTDRPRPATQSYVGGSVEFTLSTELGAGLKQLAQRHGSTLFMVLLTGWSILMARLSGQGDIVIGTPVANRQRTEVEALIGFFVNTLALRVKMEGNPSVEQLLNQVKTTTLSAYAHQDIPFEQVVDIVKPERSLGQSPVFQVMVTMDNTPDTGELSLPGLTLSGLDVPHTTTQFDLSLSLSDTGGRVVGSLEYASELFDRATIERFVSHFQTLLAGIVADGQQRISQLPLLTQPERQRLLISFNGTAVDYPQDRLIHQLFEEQAAHTPAAAALTYGGQSLSYQALNTQANQLAHHLISLGVRPDDRVAICVERSLGMVIGLLGILKAGGAYVPLDPGYPKERLAYMLSDSAPVALLTQAALKGTLEGLSATVPVILLDAQGTSRAHSGTDTDASAGSAFSHCPGHNPDAQALGLQPRHLAYVIYTSGSTGQPKGVMVEHGNVANLIQTHISQCKLTPADRILQFASISFDNSVAEIFPTLSVGATLILRPIDLRIPDPQFITFLQSHQITFADLPTAFWHHWAQEIQLNQSQPVSTLRLVVVGGEKTELRHLASWMAQLNLFDGRLIHNYGPTEATVNATAIAFDSQSSLPINDIPIGRPIANTQIYILDAHLQPVPLGVAGEIYIGGAGVARGYLNRPGLTAERFVANPFGQTEEGTQGGAHPHANNTGPSARLYKTGDLGRWLPDGTIEFLGRNDFQVKIRGFRIELGEVESQLSKCPGVREAVVIAREDSPGDKRLVAYLLARDNAELSAADLRSQLAAVLADHQLPGAYVTLESFPLTPNGKLDRKALPAPDGASVVSRGYEAPQGPIETAIARIWQELLQLDQVGRHDHFFELGGHSLLIVTLIERLRQQGLSANVRTVFTAPVLAEMAAAIDGSDNGHSLAFVVPANLIPSNIDELLTNEVIEEFRI